MGDGDMRRINGFERLEKRTPPASLFGALANFFDDEGSSDLKRRLRSALNDDANDSAPALVSARRIFDAFKWSRFDDDDNRWWRWFRRDDEIRQRTQVNELFVENFPKNPDEIIGDRTGRAGLERNGDEIELKLSTRGLTPGHAYTVWWVIFNNPSACVEGCFLDEITQAQQAAADPNDNLEPPPAEVSVLYADGAVANARGRASFRAELEELDMTGPVLFGPALTNAQSAEVHAVVRTHGKASDDPDTLNQQLTTFNGGCPPDQDPFQCVDIQVGVFPAPDAV